MRYAAAEVFGKRIVPNWLPWAAAGGTAVALLSATVGLWNGAAPCGAGRPPIAGNTGPIAHIRRPTDLTKGAAGGWKTHTGDKHGSGHRSHRGRGHDRTRATVGGASDPTRRRLRDTRQRLYASCSACGASSTSPAAPIRAPRPLQQGLDCLTQRGTSVPVAVVQPPGDFVVLSNDDAGESHQIVLTHLDDEHARIELGGTTHEIKIGELLRYWIGDYVMLWHPGTSQVKALSPGMHGPDVRWLRESLQHAARRAQVTAPVSDVFDTELANLVLGFPTPTPAYGRWHRRSPDPDCAGERRGWNRRAATVRSRHSRRVTRYVVHSGCAEKVRNRSPTPERPGVV